MTGNHLESVLSHISGEAIARDTSLLVQQPSVTGDERSALETLARIAEHLGLDAELVEFDLDAVRSEDGYPGLVARREELLGLAVTLSGSQPGADRLLLNGHVDVVPPGPVEWAKPPWSGAIEGQRIHGRGSVDMKGGVIAALHALAAIRDGLGALPGDLVLHAVSSEEDGGQGTFAMLSRDAAFAGCVIPEPTGLRVACAHSGFLQFRGTIHGVSAHAATRLEGVSALDVYQTVHTALRAFERRENRHVSNALMRKLPLPYPVVVGRIEGGNWPSQVPDELTFEGRVGIPVSTSGSAVWRRLEAAIKDAVASEPRASVQLEALSVAASGDTAPNAPLTIRAVAASNAELGAAHGAIGVPWGADMREVVRRGIPCIMFGPSGIERAHGVDEWVDGSELATVSRFIARLVVELSAASGRDVRSTGQVAAR
jgi:acetylornithine deacetylase